MVVIRDTLHFLNKLFWQTTGYANAPRVKLDPSTQYYNNVWLLNSLGPGYWRTAPDRYAERVRSNVPKEMIEGVNSLFNCTVSLMVCKIDLFSILAKLSGGRPISWASRHLATPNDQVIIEMNPATPFNQLAKEIKRLPFKQEFIIFSRHQKSGVCVYTQGIVSESVDSRLGYGKRLLVNHPHHDYLTKIGWVPLHTEIEHFILHVTGSYSEVHTLSISNHKNITDQLNAFDGQDNTPGTQLLISAIQHGWQVLKDRVVDEALPHIASLVQKEVLPSLTSGGLHNVSLAWERLSEILHIFLDPDITKKGQELKSVQDLVKDYLKVPSSVPLETRVYPYSMTILAELVMAYILEDPDPDFSIVLTDREYFESYGLVQYAAGEDRISYVASLTDIVERPSVIVSALHPCNPTIRNQTSPDILQCVDLLLAKGWYSSGFPLVLIIDITMDEYLDPALADLVSSLADRVQSGALSVHLFQSGAKLLQLGADIVPGGIYIGLGATQMRPIEAPSLMMKKLTSHMAFLLQEMAPFTHDYVKMIRANHRYAYQRLKHLLEGSGLLLIENTDDQTSYLSFQICGQESCQSAIAVMVRNIMMVSHQIGSRGSFGFSEVNVTDIKGVIRFSFGIESKASIDKTIGIIVSLGDMIKFGNRLGLLSSPERTRKFESALMKFKELGHSCVPKKAHKIKVEMTESWGNTCAHQIVKMALEFSLQKKSYVLSYWPTNKRVDWDLSLSKDETIIIHLLLLLGRIDLLKVQIDDGDVSTSFSENFMHYLNWGGSKIIHQQFPSESELSLSQIGEMVLTTQHQQFQESDLYIKHPRAPHIVLNLGRLPKDKILSIFGRCESHAFSVEDYKGMRILTLGAKRIDRYQLLGDSLKQSPRVSIFTILSWHGLSRYVGATCSRQDRYDRFITDCAGQYDWQEVDIEILVAKKQECQDEIDRESDLSEASRLRYTHAKKQKRLIGLLLDKFFMGYLVAQHRHHKGFKRLLDLKGITWGMHFQGADLLSNLKPNQRYRGTRLNNVANWLISCLATISFTSIYDEHILQSIKKFVSIYRLEAVSHALSDSFQRFIDTMAQSLQKDTEKPEKLSILIRVFMIKLLPEQYLSNIPRVITQASSALKTKWLEERPYLYHHKMNSADFICDIPDPDDLCIYITGQERFVKLFEQSGLMDEALSHKYWKGAFDK